MSVAAQKGAVPGAVLPDPVGMTSRARRRWKPGRDGPDGTFHSVLAKRWGTGQGNEQARPQFC